MCRFLNFLFVVKKLQFEIFDVEILSKYTKTAHYILIILQILAFSFNLDHLEWGGKGGNGFLVLFRNLALFMEHIS